MMKPPSGMWEKTERLNICFCYPEVAGLIPTSTGLTSAPLFQVCVCLFLTGPASPAELTCDTLVLLSTNLTGGSRFSLVLQQLFKRSNVSFFVSVGQQGPWLYSTGPLPSATPLVCISFTLLV